MRVFLLRTVAVLTSLSLTSISGFILGWAESTADAKKGKARYEQYCAVCHGSRGLGDGPMAKATSPPATKLTSPEVRNKTDQDLLSAIADGMGSTMPAWRGLLNDQELRDVLAYIRSLGG
ncbi:MAG: cytochrome c [Acidobacteria bacterium]|nr:cytochrome c [Acidobacteriota bacterium]